MRVWVLVLKKKLMTELDYLSQWEEFLWLQGIPTGPEIGNAIFLVCMTEDIKHYNYEDDPNNTTGTLGCL
jgi:hypothetical protein